MKGLAISHTHKIRVLTLNIHKGFSTLKLNFTLAKLKSAISETRADLVCLQEVVGQSPEFERKAQFEFLADQIWQHYAYGENAIRSHGQWGNAILSHYPFVFHKNINITNYSLEQRGILYGIIQVPALSPRRLHIMTLHLDLMPWGRQKQITKLCHSIQQEIPANEPLIVCGDFNDWGEEVSHRLFDSTGLQEAHVICHGYHARTYPAFLPMLKLDRIYIRHVRVDSIKRLDNGPWKSFSDHLGLIADLSFD